MSRQSTPEGPGSDTFTSRYVDTGELRAPAAVGS